MLDFNELEDREDGEDSDNRDFFRSLESKWYTTPCLLLVFSGAMVINWQLGLGIIFLAGVTSLLYQVGPEWLHAVGFFGLLVACCIKHPIIMSLLGIGLVAWYFRLLNRL